MLPKTKNPGLEAVLITQLVERLTKLNPSFRDLSELIVKKEEEAHEDKGELYFKKVAGEVKLDKPGFLVLSCPMGDPFYFAALGIDLKAILPSALSGLVGERVYGSVMAQFEKIGSQLDIAVLEKRSENGIGWCITQSKKSESIPNYLRGLSGQLKLS